VPYIANTPDDREAMLKVIGVKSMDELWRQAMVTEPVPCLDFLSEGKSEIEVIGTLSGLAALNRPDLVCFAGGGYYQHFIPAAISHIAERGEFLTSYTPYQAEASQGTLQAIYEYQSAICRITAMQVSNASLYDGGTALFEAVLMALRKGPGKKILVAGSLSPIYRKMMECSSAHLGAEMVLVGDGEGPQTAEELRAHLDRDTAAVVIQYPDFFGGLHDWSGLVQEAKQNGAITICSCYPVSLSLLKPPGEMGFDIVTGEGQSLGNPLSFGGPYLGFMATTRELMRKMPGRVCGRTVDGQGTSGFVLTLQAREQHIRRDKATSNICTNQALLALRAIIFLSLLGKSGFRRIGELCAAKAVYARERLLKITGVESVLSTSFFNEFVVELPDDADALVSQMIPKGFVAGIPLGLFFPQRRRQLLIAVTELRTKEEIDHLAAAIKEAL
jgi:glycine dehydrogenase subunit 1